MPSTGLRYPGAFSNRTGMRRIVTVIPVAGAIRDWTFESLPDGAVSSVPDLVGLNPLTVSGAQVITDSGKKYLRFDGVDDYAEALNLTLQAQPLTIIVAGRVQGTIAANKYIFGNSSTTAPVTIGTTGSPVKSLGFAGAAITGLPNVDNARHVWVASYNGASSVVRVDAAEVAGNAGANSLQIPRLGGHGAGNFTQIDISRVAILPYAAGATERAALVAQLT